MQTSICNKLIYAALLLLLVLTPLPYGTVEVWSVTLWELVIFALVLLWAVDVCLTGRLMIGRTPLVWPLLGLLLLALAQLWLERTYEPYATRQAAVKMLASWLFLLLFATFVNTEERRGVAAKVIIAVGALIALLALGQSYLGKLFWQRGAFGPFVNRNHFAGFLAMSAGLAGGLLIGRGTRREWLAVYASALLLLCAGLVLSASRGGWLALLAGLIFLVMLTLTGRERAKGTGRLLQAAAVLLLGAGAIGGAVWLTGSEGLVANFAQLDKDLQAQSVSDERYNRRDIWRASWQLVQDHPLAGVGLGAFPFAYTRYDPSSGAQRVEQTHNDYLQILTDGGAIGGVLALSFLCVMLARGIAAARARDWRRRAVARGALAGCFALTVHSLVDFNLQVTANAQLFLALCVLATARNARFGNDRGNVAGDVSD